MVNPSTLRQGGYIPLHGDWWNRVLNGRISSRNPFNELERVTDKKIEKHYCQVDRPDPHWSVGHINRWIQHKCHDTEDVLIHSIQQCWACFVPIPQLSCDAAGLFPAFHNDAFGIAGVPGLQQWILDSGASSSCTSDLTLFSSLSHNVPFKRIRVANGKYADVKGIGTVQLHLVDSKTGTTVKLQLKDVLYIPAVPVNLISTRDLWNHSKISTTFADKCTLRFSNGIRVEFDSGNSGHYYCVARSPGFKPQPSEQHFQNTQCFTCSVDDGALYATSKTQLSADVVHARLGHCGPDRASQALKSSTGLPQVPLYKQHLSKVCEGCKLGGARKHPFHSIPTQHRPQRFGDRIHSDLCGEFPVSVTGGYKYILCFVDAATGYGEIYFLQSKHSSEVKQHFEAFVKKWKHKLPDGVVREWFTDNGGEFVSSDLNDFCDEFVTKRGFTVPYCSPQNAQAERLWGILQRCIRISLAHSGMPQSFWHYAARQAMLLHNMLPRHSNPDHKSPYELVHGEQPDFSNVRVWGCLCYCTLRNEGDRDSRVSPTGAKAVHLGRDEHRRGWLVYIPSLNRITTSRDITFDEERFLRFDKQGNVVDDTEKFVDDDGSHINPIRLYNDTLQQGRWRDSSTPATTARTSDDARHDPSTIPAQPQPRRAGTDGPGWSHADATQTHFSSQQCANPNCTIPSVNGRHDGPCSFERFNSDRNHATRANSRMQASTHPDAIFFSVPSVVASTETEDHSDETWSINLDRLGEIPIPNTYEEAMASRFAHKWKEAMDREMRELLERGTWETSTVPHGRKATRSRWVFTIKYKSDGTIERFKARFVVCGYSQVHGVDYEQCFSSTMRGTTFRTLVSIAAKEGLRAEHVDISNAFCQADIDGVDIWVQPPRGFEGFCKPGQALKLIKALYGTKQASFLWQQTLSKWLASQGFTRLRTDPCVFTRGTGRDRVIIGCYVDDLIILHDKSTNTFPSFLSAFLRSHGGRFDGKHLGALEWFLGVKVTQRVDGEFRLDQSKYINDLLAKFIPNSDSYAYARKTPYPESLFKNLQEASSDAEIERVKKLPYLQLVGSLLYLATMSRPDIAYYMGVLCSFMQNPSLQCFEAAQSVLLYCGKTRHLALRYSRTFAVPECLASHAESIRSNGGLHAFSDSTWTAPKSICGYSVFMCGGPIAWSSRKLNVISDSSAYSEYSCASATTKELSFVRNVLSELSIKLHGPILLAVDNRAAIRISEQRGVTKLTKHFDFAVHRIRDEVEHGRVRCAFVETYYQTADIFTKPLGDQVFVRHRDTFFARA